VRDWNESIKVLGEERMPGGGWSATGMGLDKLERNNGKDGMDR